MSDLVGLTRLAPGRGGVLVLGAGLGTTAALLWRNVLPLLDDVEIWGVDLPGHGGAPAIPDGFTVADLAADLARQVSQRADHGRCWYAGVSLAGAVAFELAAVPGPFCAVLAVAAATSFGEPAAWTARAALVRRFGTAELTAGSRERWFAPGFAEREPDVVAEMLNALAQVDAESYARCCEALGTYDLRGRGGPTAIPLTVAPGELDTVVPPEQVVRDAVAGIGVRTLAGCAHQPPVEDPKAVAALLIDLMHPQEKA